jgi:hypothetical protein
MTSHPHAIPAGTLGPVTVLGAHILDVLGRPVEAIPPGQGSARLTEIRATAAGTAAGTESLGQVLDFLDFLGRTQPEVDGRITARTTGGARP